MKLLKFTAVLSLVALMVAGCEQSLPTNPNGNGGQSLGTGKLSVSSLVLDCRIDENDPEFGLDSASPMATRSTTNLDEFNCSIINDKGEEVLSFTYGERPQEDIELPTGDYIFHIVSGEIKGVDWDSPVYGCDKPFKIVRGETTPLGEVVCSLLNIKVSLSFSADLLERLGEKTVTEISVGENTIEFALTEKRAAFFLAPQVSNTIHLCVSGTYAADKVTYKTIEMTKEVRDVKAGQHSKIHLKLDHNAEGNIVISVELRDWITDEIIPCNIGDNISEEEWQENEGGENEDDNEQGDDDVKEDPSIIWEGHDISQREQVVAGLDVNIVVESSAGIKEFVVKIISESLTAAELANNNLCDTMNLCYPDQSFDSTTGTIVDVTQPLTDLGFVVGNQVIDQKYVRLSISTFMGVLSGVSGPEAKNHDFELTVTDNNNVTTKKTLMLKTGN